MSKNDQPANGLNLVYVVTSYGRIVGVYADSKDAFDVQMLSINKNRLAEMVPCPVIYPQNLKTE